MTPMLTNHLQNALSARASLLAGDARHEGACRLFNGFVEGEPSLAVDLYGQTLLIHDYRDDGDGDGEMGEITAVADFYRAQMPWLQAILHKRRRAASQAERNGQLLYGTKVTSWVREYGVRYALDLTLNRDSSFYLDTRYLRHWLKEHSHGRDILNTFAYTSSLGVAAQAGGAKSVLHTDLNKTFLNIAKTSYTLNGFPISKQNFISDDFWPLVNRLKRAGRQFDIVIIDPPFFASTSKGTLDLAEDSARLINKVRPLVRHGGQIITINNALFVSGAAYWAALQSVTQDGYVTVGQVVDVPPDFTGYESTAVNPPISDPTPFNHTTKIAMLEVRHQLG
jgi:23S rRNA (cytosine1962-C5)-methyltransferase